MDITKPSKVPSVNEVLKLVDQLSADEMAKMTAELKKAAGLRKEEVTVLEERTFVAIKPDGVERGLIAEIIGRFERRGLKLVGLKLMQLATDLAEKHYGEHKGKPFFDGLVKHITSGPIVAMVWEGKGAVAICRSTIGATSPAAAVPGTIRGDLAVDIARNIVHGSDSLESAKREIDIFFSMDELVKGWQQSSHKWIWE